MSAAPLEFSADTLLDAVGKLPPDQLDAFVEQVIQLRAQAAAPSLGERESELMQQVNAALPKSDQDRYRELKKRRDAESLTPGEHAELLGLCERMEALNAARLAALTELARHRGTSLRGLMKELGIPAATDE